MFLCILCTATPDISSSSKSINNTARVSRLFYCFLWLWSLAIEMFCDGRNLSSPIMNSIFMQKNNNWYNLRQVSKFVRPLMKSVYQGSEWVSFLGLKIWDMLPDDCKDIDNLNTFKNKVEKSKLENCPCRLCKIYINNIGFVWERKKSLEYSSSVFTMVAVACQ